VKDAHHISLEEKILMTIVKVAERFKRESSALFGEYGLAFSQYNVLRVLAAAPDGTAACADVGRVMLLSGPNLTGIAKRLEKAGLIVRRNDVRDERRKRLAITPQGREVLRAIGDNQERLVQSFVADCPDQVKKDLLRRLQVMLRR